MVLVDADENNIIIKATAFRSIFPSAQKIISVEPVVLVHIVLGMDLSFKFNKVEPYETA